MAGLIRRISSVLSSTVHDALDSAESPDGRIRQLVRESTDNVTRVRTLAIEAVASEKSLGKAVEQHERQASDWKEAAASAMSAGDEVKARAALARKIEQDNLLEPLKAQHETACSNSETLKDRLKELERSLTALKSKQAGLVARHKGAVAIEQTSKVASNLHSQRDVDEQVSRAEELVADLEARNLATVEVDSAMRPGIDLDAERDASRLERELDALRDAR